MEEGADAGDAADAEVMAAHRSQANLKPRTIRAARHLRPHSRKPQSNREDHPVLARIRAASKIAVNRIDVRVVASSSGARAVIAGLPIRVLLTLESIRLRWTTAIARISRTTMEMGVATPVATRNSRRKH